MSYQATQTPSDLAGSGWYELLPAPPPAVELRSVETADWVIVGAGFAGLAAARGTLSGLLIAEHAAGESNAMIEHLLTPPALLPPRPLMSLAARARIAWGERRAGADR